MAPVATLGCAVGSHTDNAKQVLNENQTFTNATADSCFHSACHNCLLHFPLSHQLSTLLHMPIGTIRMRATQPHFPSISFVLSQASSLMHLANSHPNLFAQKSELLLPPIHDDLMQTVDERTHISHAGLNVASAYILEHNDGLVSLREVLTTNEIDDPLKIRRLSISSLVIDLALALRHKCRQKTRSRR